MSSLFLSDFRSMAPRIQAKQRDALEWIAEAHARAEIRAHPPANAEEEESITRRIRKLVLRYGCSTDRIEFRCSSLEDFSHHDWERMKIFSLDTHPAGKQASDRSRFFSQTVNEAFQRFYAEEKEAPAAIVHVTCTGYVSPSGAQELVSERGWGMETEVLHAYHMGCYAALPSLRIARGALGGGRRRVDLVHTELCTLHLDPMQHAPEQLVVQTLFSDGLIRYSCTTSAPELGPALEVVALREEIIPGSQECMSWMASDHGMQMYLSRQVPQKIGAALKDFLARLVRGTGASPESAVFAIHPGGPKIIDEVQALLELQDEQVTASNQVLRNRGNMSSATLPHIWKEILNAPNVPPASWVVALAFGPGLTLSGAVLRKTA